MVKSSLYPNKVYKYLEKEDVPIITPIKDRSFENEWLLIREDGEMIVKGSNKKGYAWDGCTPKWNVLHFTVGTPDGMFNFDTGKPMTYYASMVHDVLYQFKEDVDISRKEADIIFRDMLRDSGFMWWWVYYWGVRIGGGFFGKWKRK